ncbi:hypothetical protein AALO_G00185140 [Alosa alosa]|uniref:Uncharacterized protein n=1 Tax=Alosa alosa TaxID=278164 RepID=A0AAV6G9S2_9TELE|nr:uncharacterized protein LOC125306396 [Alosa alosa]KAG5271879.1 hypothetical protein AALO_G00185140 [Alosa alosa]
MKLGELFSCCLPLRRKKHRNERVDTSKKKLRKETKRLKKKMADRRRKEALELDISKVQSVETIESLDDVKDGSAERIEGENAMMAIHHVEMANSSPVSHLRAEKEIISVPDPEFSKEDCNPKESSVHQGTPQLDEREGRTLTLHDGDGTRPVPRVELDWGTAKTPGERDVFEEQRRKTLRGFFERRGLTSLNAATQPILSTEDEKPRLSTEDEKPRLSTKDEKPIPHLQRLKTKEMMEEKRRAFFIDS